MRRWGGWLVPLLTALVVVGLVLGVTAAVRGGNGSGGTGLDDGDRVARPPSEATRTPEPADLAPGAAALTGYRSVEQRLTLAYELGPDCAVSVTGAAVAEGRESVIVRLQGTPLGEGDECVPRGRLTLPLLTPVLYRAVLDGAADDRSVPPIR